MLYNAVLYQIQGISGDHGVCPRSFLLIVLDETNKDSLMSQDINYHKSEREEVEIDE